MSDIQWLRRLMDGRAARERLPDTEMTESEVYETLYGDRSSRLSVVEVIAETPPDTPQRPNRRTAPKRPAPSRAVG